MQVVELKPRSRMTEDDRADLANHLLDLVKDVQDGKVESFFGAWSYGPTGTSGLRIGNQTLDLLGRVEWLKLRMAGGME